MLAQAREGGRLKTLKTANFELTSRRLRMVVIIIIIIIITTHANNNKH